MRAAGGVFVHLADLHLKFDYVSHTDNIHYSSVENRPTKMIGLPAHFQNRTFRWLLIFIFEKKCPFLKIFKIDIGICILVPNCVCGKKKFYCQNKLHCEAKMQMLLSHIMKFNTVLIQVYQ